LYLNHQTQLSAWEDLYIKGRSKGKVHPRTGHEGPVSVRWDCDFHQWCSTHPTRVSHRVHSDMSVVTLEIAFSDHGM
jgi:hypothetical protein